MGFMGICCDESSWSKGQAEIPVFMHMDILNQSFSQPTRALWRYICLHLSLLAFE